VVLADPYVSRRHVAIVVHAHGGCELHDVASKNGTLINGHGISGPTRLNSGDHIRLSDHLLIFLCHDDGGRSAVEHTQAE
jgi:pSer/pThr/pTyr-binding forkhead associated (FHA) protein